MVNTRTRRCSFLDRSAICDHTNRYIVCARHNADRPRRLNQTLFQADMMDNCSIHHDEEIWKLIEDEWGMCSVVGA